MEEFGEEMIGLVKVLENKQNQITKLETKIQKLESNQNVFNDMEFSKTIDEIDFMSNQKGKRFAF